MPVRDPSDRTGPTGRPRRKPVTLTRSRVCARAAGGSTRPTARQARVRPRVMGVWGSGLLGRTASARHPMAFRATGPVLGPDRVLQVYAGNVRQGRQPGQDVRELGGRVFLRPVPA